MTRKAPPATPPDESEWGFEDKAPRMKIETKLGLCLVFCLVTGFSFVLHQKWSKIQRQQLPGAAAASEAAGPQDATVDPGLPPVASIPAEPRHGQQNSTASTKTSAAEDVNPFEDGPLASVSEPAPAMHSRTELADTTDAFAELPAQQEHTETLDPFASGSAPAAPPVEREFAEAEPPAFVDPSPPVDSPTGEDEPAMTWQLPSESAPTDSSTIVTEPADPADMTSEELPQFGELPAAAAAAQVEQGATQQEAEFFMELVPVEPEVPAMPEAPVATEQSASNPFGGEQQPQPPTIPAEPVPASEMGNPFSLPATNSPSSPPDEEAMQIFAADDGPQLAQPAPVEPGISSVNPGMSAWAAPEREPAGASADWTSTGSPLKSEPGRLQESVTEALPTFSAPDLQASGSGRLSFPETARSGTPQGPQSTATTGLSLHRETGESVAAEREWVVTRSDSFWSISQAVYDSGRYFSALARYNADRVQDPTRLALGTRLRVPPPEVLEAEFPQLFVPQASSESSIVPTAGESRRKSPPTGGLFLNGDHQPIYRVAEDDTLSEIARRHLGRASRWQEIFDLNRDRLKSPQDLTIGTILRLPADASQVALPPTASSRR